MTEPTYDFWGPEQAATFAGKNTEVMRRYFRSGECKAVKAGSAWRTTKEWVLEWMERCV